MNFKIIVGLITALLLAVAAYYKNETSKESSSVKIENSTVKSDASTTLNITDSVIQNGNGNSVVKNAK